MKTFITKGVLLFVCILITSCNINEIESEFIVTTKVTIKEGEIDEVLKLFKETNPELVKNQPDWLKALFSKSDETNSVVVQAHWKNKESYLKFSKSEKFQNTMKQFGKHFNGKPNVEINEILFKMKK